MSGLGTCLSLMTVVSSSVLGISWQNLVHLPSDQRDKVGQNNCDLSPIQFQSKDPFVINTNTACKLERGKFVIGTVASYVRMDSLKGYLLSIDFTQKVFLAAKHLL